MPQARHCGIIAGWILDNQSIIMLSSTYLWSKKRKIIEDISHAYVNLLKSGKVDAERGKLINDKIQGALAKTFNALSFEHKLKAFFAEFPEFSSLSKKLYAEQMERVHELGQECLEPLTEDRCE